MTDLIELALESRFASAAILSFGQGLRREEVLGLRWSDVDLEEGRLYIRRALVAWARPSANQEAEPIWKEPKTEESRRTVLILRPFLEPLRAERVAQLRARMQLGSGWQGAASPEDDQVVAMEDGRPWRPSSFSRAWRKFITENASRTPYLTTKDGRSAFVSLAYAAGVDPTLIARLAGHSVQTAQAHYLRPILGSEVAAAETLAQSYLRPPGESD